MLLSYSNSSPSNAGKIHGALLLSSQELQVDLGHQLKLQHFVAALEASDAAVFAGRDTKYLQGEAMMDEGGLNFTVKQVGIHVEIGWGVTDEWIMVMILSCPSLLGIEPALSFSTQL